MMLGIFFAIGILACGYWLLRFEKPTERKRYQSLGGFSKRWYAEDLLDHEKDHRRKVGLI